MTDYYPNKFLLVEIELPDEKVMKVFGSWSGGYLDGDSWRMNSGIENVRVEDGMYHFNGYTGSTYVCAPDSYGAHVYGQSIINTLIEKASVPVRLLTEEEMQEYISQSIPLFTEETK
jgi:hypothetical protein